MYATEDKRYTTNAKAVTTNRFEPSGSLNKKNNILEQMKAVNRKSAPVLTPVEKLFK